MDNDGEINSYSLEVLRYVLDTLMAEDPWFKRLIKWNSLISKTIKVS